MPLPTLPVAQALVVAELVDHPELPEQLGGRVAGEPGDVYPCAAVRVTPAGRGGNYRWLVSPELQIEVWDTPDATRQLGPHAMQQVLLRTLQIVYDMPEREYGPGEPVVTSIEETVLPQPLPVDGQPRWLAGVIVTAHPAPIV